MMAFKKLLIKKTNGGVLHAVFFFTSNQFNEQRPIVILCHGFGGDKYEWNRFSITAIKLIKKGYDAIIFDFSGSGENIREPILLSKQVKDLKDVYNWTRNKGYSQIAVIGLSFGGLTTLFAELPEIQTTIFWAPAFFLRKIIGKYYSFIRILELLHIKQFRLPQFGPNKSLIVNGEFVEEMQNLNFFKKLKNLQKPTLIIQGLEDTDVKPSFTREAYNYIPNRVDHKLIEIEGADHEFQDVYLDRFINFTISWLDEYLK
ncbi:MAG: abhydrolase domain-containing 18 [Candidatus Lokiarchaeota archaeon]|nr:abhydrolase domain-containing 18 [Candidatus Lokiarchaeota archaeon]MBD3199359.1 abhydrolase domain-containing 18 [Candidatus Lokiarchaeota archaeon]